ncbi:MAG: 6-carboxyhexanoate--CoA ligase [Nitrospirae bacterium CG_4_10_14_0_8_um_filter_41_23]|nr:MAG: 6-carboxyhexanoate--CoA ligase [Nitrospirae bacterium CG11_big_fil_rev_8_21_14_0_20_41_14]PIV43438.1 MAG: 6-carboxyhexanoate--CoA ligase [Nitrospirae bacterium CG02_land_8_20_14_3_00_41_53]PIW87914.1 MAG: 6-carboxyhexanoate--CoA ligase [Nitrospirae bacterium CG_4_8_14_3_um_filter_41_47]PIY87064.1 MAG: 6-carboxyhexanoate--CoA ligase [Nitrospirae bacterium CG_4_10_14_0_8_um_filter_41_23]PJA79070.1 MAG: 6-carboxyhexanoate--CoA ligase [Nitrospirae bacterium CG_4_9_14_3_um_filter_41_27]
MENLWSIRMRASKKAKNSNSKILNPKSDEIHISGAEGLYEASEIQRIVKRYIERALNHPKGKADKIIVTIEDIKQKPKEISTLSLSTVDSNTPAEGKNIAIKLLQSLGISNRAIDTAFELIKKGSMRGAAIITVGKGDRLEPDKERGVRVSRIGINKSALKMLSLRLSNLGINTDTVKEALVIASKVAVHRHILAELCVSDDPFYTTGYVASKKFGYLRIPNIKHAGNKSGGRAFFVKGKINVEEIINYFEKVPVIIGRVVSCRGIISIDEILNRPYK